MVIGLMGGIGSGKSTVLDYLEQYYNAEIIQADLVAKEVMKPGHQVFEKVVQIFPDVIKDGQIDSGKLSEVVFSDETKLQKLNAITHPGTVEEIISQIKNSTADIIVVESALMLGSGLEAYVDELWFVFCEKNIRIERLIENRGYTREKAEQIIANQPSDEEYNLAADEFIDNSHSAEATRERIDILLSAQDCGE